jgi:hypothetical protein
LENRLIGVNKNETNKVKNQYRRVGGIQSQTTVYYRKRLINIKWVVIGERMVKTAPVGLLLWSSDSLVALRLSLPPSLVHETDLKKQGMIALTFLGCPDYDKAQPKGKNLTSVMLSKYDYGLRMYVP